VWHAHASCAPRTLHAVRVPRASVVSMKHDPHPESGPTARTPWRMSKRKSERGRAARPTCMPTRGTPHAHGYHEGRLGSWGRTPGDRWTGALTHTRINASRTRRTTRTRAAIPSLLPHSCTSLLVYRASEPAPLGVCPLTTSRSSPQRHPLDDRHTSVFFWSSHVGQRLWQCGSSQVKSNRVESSRVRTDQDKSVQV